MFKRAQVIWLLLFEFLWTLGWQGIAAEVSLWPQVSSAPGANYKIIWDTEPGMKYRLERSSDLQSWTAEAGYPIPASGIADQFSFTATGERMFYRVSVVDEQPPTIAARSPANRDFSVKRQGKVEVQLVDASAINGASIQLTVGTLGTFGTNDARVSFVDNRLTFEAGAGNPLAGYGETVSVSLVVADVLGNSTNHVWTFDLEGETQVAANLFVFGSSQAQLSGQQSDGGGGVRAVLAGQPRTSASGDWRLAEVLPDRIVISYTGSAPALAVGTYVCNQTPTKADQIFYRKVNARSDDTTNRRLTLFTQDVPLTEIMPKGSLALSGESRIYEVGEDSALMGLMGVFEREFELPSVGADVSGVIPHNSGQEIIKLDLASIWLHSKLKLAFENAGGELQRFTLHLDGKIEAELVTTFYFDLINPVYKELEFELFSRKRMVFVGMAGGVVPVWAELKFTLESILSFQMAVDAYLRTGITQDIKLDFQVDYDRATVPKVRYESSVTVETPEFIPLTYTFNGAAELGAKLIPQFDFRLYSLVGFYFNIDPRVEIDGQAMLGPGGYEADWRMGFYADLNAGLSVAGVDQEDLPAADPIRLFKWERTQYYPTPVVINIRQHPVSQTVQEGANVHFEVNAFHVLPLTYQWYHRGIPLPGKTNSTLELPDVKSAHTGLYHVRVSTITEQAVSTNALLVVLPPGPTPMPVPEGMVLVPAGSFNMGDAFHEGQSKERPVHQVYVSSFFMDKFEVTKTQWESVKGWATTNGYAFFQGFYNPDDGLAKGGNHPVTVIDWFDAIKWCNAKSEKEGVTPAYYHDVNFRQVIRSGDLFSQIHIKWDGGYRLPTEAEWEKAARGGVQGQRFPTGNTLTHQVANYNSYSGFAYDTSQTRGWHPTYGSGALPWTSPGGSFAPNGYGLYDMEGNVSEWCWDWYGEGYYAVSPGANPKGSATGVYRIIRGSAWWGGADSARVANRTEEDPRFKRNEVGFRTVRSAAP